jgi:hypothetical protein
MGNPVEIDSPETINSLTLRVVAVDPNEHHAVQGIPLLLLADCAFGAQRLGQPVGLVGRAASRSVDQPVGRSVKAALPSALEVDSGPG